MPQEILLKKFDQSLPEIENCLISTQQFLFWSCIQVIPAKWSNNNLKINLTPNIKRGVIIHRAFTKESTSKGIHLTSTKITLAFDTRTIFLNKWQMERSKGVWAITNFEQYNVLCNTKCCLAYEKNSYCQFTLGRLSFHGFIWMLMLLGINQSCWNWSFGIITGWDFLSNHFTPHFKVKKPSVTVTGMKSIPSM